MKKFFKDLWTKMAGLFKAREKKKASEDIFAGLETKELEIFIGSDLTEFGEDIATMIKKLRSEMKNNNGLVLPFIEVKDKSDLQENEFRILVKDNVKYTGFAIPNKEQAIPEIKSCLTKICEENISEILSAGMVDNYINFVWRKSWCLCNNVLTFFTITSIKQILVYLLENGESIKDIEYIFEKMCEYGSIEKDKCFFRAPLPIAKEILYDLRQRNMRIEKVESILKY